MFITIICLAAVIVLVTTATTTWIHYVVSTPAGDGTRTELTTAAKLSLFVVMLAYCGLAYWLGTLWGFVVPIIAMAIIAALAITLEYNGNYVIREAFELEGALLIIAFLVMRGRDPKSLGLLLGLAVAIAIITYALSKVLADTGNTTPVSSAPSTTGTTTTAPEETTEEGEDWGSMFGTSEPSVTPDDSTPPAPAPAPTRTRTPRSTTGRKVDWSVVIIAILALGAVALAIWMFTALVMPTFGLFQ